MMRSVITGILVASVAQSSAKEPVVNQKSDVQDSKSTLVSNLADKLIDKLINSGALMAWPDRTALDNTSLMKVQDMRPVRGSVAPYTRPTFPASHSLFSSIRSPVTVTRFSVPHSTAISASLPKALPLSRDGTVTRAETAEAEAPAEEKEEDEADDEPAKSKNAAWAHARWIRGSPSKMRRVLNTIRGRTYEEALMILEYMPYRACEPISKVLLSAAANANNNLGLKKSDLVITTCFADQGPIMKRFRPRAQGKAGPIQKKTSHISIEVTSIPGRVKAKN